MTSRDFTHIAFSDESNYGNGRFRSISVVSMPKYNLRPLIQNGQSILQKYSLGEFGWHEVDGINRAKATAELFYSSFDMCRNKEMRVDTLCWDSQSNWLGNHDGKDLENFHKMYQRLLRRVMQDRWQADGWSFRPDENEAVDWSRIQNFLQGKHHKNFRLPNSEFRMRAMFQDELRVTSITPTQSGDSIGVQLADLHAGLANFTRQKSADFRRWQFDKEHPCSRIDTVRFGLVERLISSMEDHGFKISLDHDLGLTTQQSSCPVNFWPYHDRTKKILANVKEPNNSRNSITPIWVKP